MRLGGGPPPAGGPYGGPGGPGGPGYPHHGGPGGPGYPHHGPPGGGGGFPGGGWQGPLVGNNMPRVESRHYMAGIGTTAIVASLLVFILGFASVEVTEYGLNYSLVYRKVEKKTYGAGRYWIGPLNFFVKFPATVTTIQFSDSNMQNDLTYTERGEQELRSRTKDGLDVLIELSFQYQLMASKIYDLYTQLGGYPQYHDTFVRLAIDRLTETATKYSATEFFTERTDIGKDMQALLEHDFVSELYSHVFSFQLRSVGLPKEFEDAIQLTEVKKQDVSVAVAEQNSTRVALETQLMQAKRRTRIKSNQGEAEAESVILANNAQVAQFNATQRKLAEGYRSILKELGADEQTMLAYMRTRVLRDHPSSHAVVGLQ